MTDIDFGFIAFTRDNLDEILELTDLRREGNVIKKNGQVVRCQNCGRLIYDDCLGSILPSSEGSKIYCDDGACFSHYITNYLESDTDD